MNGRNCLFLLSQKKSYFYGEEHYVLDKSLDEVSLALQ